MTCAPRDPSLALCHGVPESLLAASHGTLPAEAWGQGGSLLLNGFLPRKPLEVPGANSVSTERADFSASRGFKIRFQAKLDMESSEHGSR